MTTATHPKLAALLDALEKDGGPGGAVKDRHRKLSAAAAGLGLQAFVGQITLAGRTSDGNYQVNYDTMEGGFGSSWPLWAYESHSPRSSMTGPSTSSLTDRLFGENLLVVLILRDTTDA